MASHMNALCYFIHINDVMKNPSGRVGYPINITGIQCRYVLKRHVLNYARSQIRVWGLKFDVGLRVFAQAINWFPDPFGCTSLVTNIPMKNKLIKEVGS